MDFTTRSHSSRSGSSIHESLLGTIAILQTACIFSVIGIDPIGTSQSNRSVGGGTPSAPYRMPAMISPAAARVSQFDAYA